MKLNLAITLINAGQTNEALPLLKSAAASDMIPVSVLRRNPILNKKIIPGPVYLLMLPA